MKVVLVTGGTGLLGGAMIAHLAARRDCRVLALVRGDAEARLARSLARFGASSQGVEIIHGDLAHFEDPRLDDATHVAHAAANTSFKDAPGVREVNVDGALALARRMARAPRLERYVHVGTAFACGIGPGGGVRGALLGEDDYPRADADHVVAYTRSKAEAELRLREIDLPLVIARPSVIVGHSTLGCGPSASLFWFYRALDRLKRVPWPLESREDIVPVDFAAEAIVALLFKPELKHARYHISAGETSCCTWREIAAAFGGAEAYRVMGEIAEDRDWAAEQFGEHARRILRAIELYCRFPSVLFDNSRLMGEGVRAPPRFTDYLQLCLATDDRGINEQMNDDS
ncbi:MAG: SDR family oxidoreductase [Hyphomonadaceae bacterium]|nr:SDR family oxidoreductase [Hyphomonadaceae bacterium]